MTALVARDAFGLDPAAGRGPSVLGYASWINDPHDVGVAVLYPSGRMAVVWIDGGEWEISDFRPGHGALVARGDFVLPYVDPDNPESAAACEMALNAFLDLPF